MARKLFIDTAEGRLVRGLDDASPASLDSLFEGDAAAYELYFVQRSPRAGTLYEAQNFADRSVKLHIGAPPPSTATAFVAQQSWSNLPSAVSATIVRTITGGASTNEQQSLDFDPEAFSGTFALTIPARTVALTGTITNGIFTSASAHGLALAEPFVTSGLGTVTGGLANGQSLFVAQVLNATQFSAATTSRGNAVTAFGAGSVGEVGTITATTRLIGGRATAQQAQSALETVPSIGAGNIRVAALPGRQYLLGYQAAKSQVELPVPIISSSLIPVFGKTGNLNFATTELANAISGSASVSAVLEVETTENGSVETVLQVPVTLRNDIIEGASPLPVSTTTATFFTLLSPDNSVFAVSVDDDGILTTEKIS